MKKLTKETAIQEHRKMWNWIAEKCEEGLKDFEPLTLEQNNIRDEYIYEIYNRPYMEGEGSFQDVTCGSFCCEYEAQNAKGTGNCDECPLNWGNSTCRGHMCAFLEKDGRASLGLASKFEYAFEACNFGAAAAYARQIAELPERNEKNK